MADYKQLLTKAIAALPENNGAQRREVYEKARKALVSQLRSVSPPLAAREITQHRLELEDCIRQVEQEATENILGGFRHVEDDRIPTAGGQQASTPEAPVPPVQPTPSAPDPNAVHELPPAGEQASPEPSAPEPAAPEPAAPDRPAPSPEAPAEPERPAEPQAAAPAPAETPEPEPESRQASAAPGPVETEAAAPEPVDPEPVEPEPAAPEPEPEAPKQKSAPAYPDDDSSSIDAIIARANAVREASPPPRVPEPTPTTPPETPPPAPGSVDDLARALGGDEAESGAITSPPENLRNEPAPDPAPPASMVSSAAVGAAMSRVREVEVDQPFTARVQRRPNEDTAPFSEGGEEDGHNESQLVIDRAIEMLDREARGERDARNDEAPPDPDEGSGDRGGTAGAATPPPETHEDELVAAHDRYDQGQDEEKGGNALTIFLVLAIVLLGVTGGAGYWAWQEDYLDLDAMFAQSEPAGDTPDEANTSGGTPALDTTEVPSGNDGEAGPGNTQTADSGLSVDELTPSEAEPDGEERLPASEGATEADGGTTGDTAGEERLPAEDATADPSMDGSPEDGGIVAGNGAQSLLLEASQSGQTGAVPYSGTVEWERGTDELGQPTLIGRAEIPARNLGVEVLLRRNGDPALPASHLVEIEFDTAETFVGGNIASFGGILFKNEELVPGRPLVGAPARVLENMFLFALSSAPEDVRTNLPLIENNKWMDLAVVYGTGRQAIITLEKDEDAEEMFDEVVSQWRDASQSASAEGEDGSEESGSS